MILNFIGKGSSFYPVLGSTSSYVVVNGELYVFDCGETVFDYLYRSGLLDRYKNVNVILTHLHSDHAGSLGSLIPYLYCIKNTVINVIYPNESVVNLLDLLGIKRSFYRHIMITDRWSDDNISLTPVIVQHVENMLCYGYIVNIGKTTIYYSGDSSDVPEEIAKAYLTGRIDEMYHDTATVRSDSHCHIDRLCELFPEGMRKNIYCIHLDGDNKEYFEALGFSVV